MSHKNRFDFLKSTLAINLSDNKNSQDIIEFILVDFDSDDDIKGWVIENFKDEIKSGYLKFYSSNELKEWDASLAKNTSHYLASGTIVVNLDCDNYTGQHGGNFVLDTFLKNDKDIVLWQYSGKKLDGSFGRIACTKKAFNEVGGYDQEFLPMGFQDGDLRDRLKASGRQLVHDKNSNFNGAIKNEKYIPANMTWKKMNEHNQKLSKDNIKNGKLMANDGIYGIRQNIYQLSPISLEMEPHQKH
ncbi:MAG: glycosyltransferase family A protein [Reichenbachiella sp.]|uniref:glycosyltransferase family A protein n=1 Tax=Reichenbachiella sp. TaxID=2184521 RepID=UPI0032998F3A